MALLHQLSKLVAGKQEKKITWWLGRRRIRIPYQNLAAVLVFYSSFERCPCPWCIHPLVPFSTLLVLRSPTVSRTLVLLLFVKTRRSRPLSDEEEKTKGIFVVKRKGRSFFLSVDNYILFSSLGFGGTVVCLNSEIGRDRGAVAFIPRLKVIRDARCKHQASM